MALNDEEELRRQHIAERAAAQQERLRDACVPTPFSPFKLAACTWGSPLTVASHWQAAAASCWCVGESSPILRAL